MVDDDDAVDALFQGADSYDKLEFCSFFFGGEQPDDYHLV